MRQKLQIIGLIFLAVLLTYIGFGVVKLTIQVILSKVTLLAAIIFFFWQYKKNHENIMKIILVVLMIMGIFAFDIMYNIIFLGLVISFLALFNRVGVRRFGVPQILMLAFVIGYLGVFGVASTVSKLLAVLSLMALFMMVIWKEMKIYFTPSRSQTKNDLNEIEFVDQNAEHNYTKTQHFFSRYVNVEMMTRDVALNITFIMYILLVMIDMLSKIIYSFFV